MAWISKTLIGLTLIFLGVVGGLEGNGVRAQENSEEIRVHRGVHGCYGGRDHDTVWVPVASGFRAGKRWLAKEDFRILRAAVLGSKDGATDLLGSLGITERSLVAHRNEILRAAFNETWFKEGDELPLVPPQIEELLRLDSIGPIVLDEVRGRNWVSTTNYVFKVFLPGDPPLVLESRGKRPWMLPWTIQAGEERWETEDLEVPRAILGLVDADGPLFQLLDGSHYWSEEFYSDKVFWRRNLGIHLDRAFSEERYLELEGYPDAHHRFRFEKVRTGNINLKPPSMYFSLAPRDPGLIDRVRWWNLLEGQDPRFDWREFLAAYDRALARLVKVSWISEWKNAGPARKISVDIVGTSCVSEVFPDRFLDPAWKHGEFLGSPQYGFLLSRGKRWSITLYFGDEGSGALITRAKRAEDPERTHWLDELDVSFHPKTPDYARVKENGEVEIRKIESPPSSKPEKGGH